MWIRSQGKECLVDAKRIKVIGKNIISKNESSADVLGCYETKERAIEVVNATQHHQENHTQYTYNMPLK